MPNQENEKYIDSTKPGVVPVSHTSKPSIVSNKKIKHDPMMLESGLEDEPETKLLKSSNSGESASPKMQTFLKTEVTKSNLPDTNSVLHKDNNQPKLQPIKTDTTQNSNLTKPEPTSNAPKTAETTEVGSAQQPISNTKSESNTDKQDLPKSVIENSLAQPEVADEAIREAIDNKTYNLPIKSTKSKSVMLVIVLIFVLVVALCFVIIKINK